MDEELGRLLIQFWALPFPLLVALLVGVGVKMPRISIFSFIRFARSYIKGVLDRTGSCFCDFPFNFGHFRLIRK